MKDKFKYRVINQVEPSLFPYARQYINTATKVLQNQNLPKVLWNLKKIKVGLRKNEGNEAGNMKIKKKPDFIEEIKGNERVLY